MDEKPKRRWFPRRMPIILASTLLGALLGQCFMPAIGNQMLLLQNRHTGPLFYGLAGALAGAAFGLLVDLGSHPPSSQD